MKTIITTKINSVNDKYNDTYGYNEVLFLLTSYVTLDYDFE